MTALFAGAALMNAAMATASAAATLVAGDRLGMRWGAVPNTAAIVGTGAGALALTWLMGRYGRRAGLTCGYLLSAAGAALAAAGVAAGDVLALTAGMLLLGLGNAGAQLTRYAAAELYPPGRRGFAIGTVVWAGAAGAVGGPLLLSPSGDLTTALGWAALTGPFALAAAATLAAAAATTRLPVGTRGGGRWAAGTTPGGAAVTGGAGGAGGADPAMEAGVAVGADPAMEAGVAAGAARAPLAGLGEPVFGGSVDQALPQVAGEPGGGGRRGERRRLHEDRGHARDGARAGTGDGRMRLRDVVRTSGARTALSVMVAAQVVMVAVMTAAPLDMHMHGQGLAAVGMTLAAHTFGMFALSPLTGRLLDRFGARPVMLGGLVTLAVATALAATMTGGHARAGALFLLGYGWNLCFVGGSGRLARDLPESARAGVEGAVDAAVWGVAAAASLASTLVLSAGGYAALAWAACALLVVPALLALRAETSGPR